jgi:hypothetical protein
MIDEISKAGIALVLSSQAHKDSALMSNRLFESLAAGALIICDENPFAKKFFGDSLLYIDSRTSVETIFADLTRHLQWARSHPDQVLAMISKSQNIFREKFTLVRNLGDLYSGLAERKRQLLARQNPPAMPALKVRLYLLMPEYSEETLRAHIESVRVQDYGNFVPCLVVAADGKSRLTRLEIERAISDSRVNLELLEVDYFSDSIHPEVKVRRPLGELIQQLLRSTSGADAFMVVAPNEKLFANHVAVLAGALQRDPSVNCAATAAILLNDGEQVRNVHECIDFGHVDRNGPPGYGRFIFRLASIPKDIECALPYLDGRPLAVLVGGNVIDQQMQATITISLRHEFPERTWDEAAENAIIRAYSPAAFTVATGFGPPRLPAVYSPPTSAPPPSSEPVPTGGYKFLSPFWIWKQLRAIQKEGLRARMKILKLNLNS